jgi:hypothetical protein
MFNVTGKLIKFLIILNFILLMPAICYSKCSSYDDIKTVLAPYIGEVSNHFKTNGIDLSLFIPSGTRDAGLINGIRNPGGIHDCNGLGRGTVRVSYIGYGEIIENKELNAIKLYIDSSLNVCDRVIFTKKPEKSCQFIMYLLKEGEQSSGYRKYARQKGSSSADGNGPVILFYKNPGYIK